MKNLKTGKTIVKFLEGCKNNKDIEDFSVDMDGDDIYTLNIRIKVNEVYSLEVFPNYDSWTSKLTEWDLRISQDGHNRYYDSCKTQKEMCESIRERIGYCTRCHNNKLKSKYEGLSQDELMSLLVGADKKIMMLEKENERIKNSVISMVQDSVEKY